MGIAGESTPATNANARHKRERSEPREGTSVLRERIDLVSPVGGALTALTGAAKQIPVGTGRGNGDVPPVNVASLACSCRIVA
jgi:hypothetical protein